MWYCQANGRLFTPDRYHSIAAVLLQNAMAESTTNARISVGRARRCTCMPTCVRMRVRVCVCVCACVRARARARVCAYPPPRKTRDHARVGKSRSSRDTTHAISPRIWLSRLLRATWKRRDTTHAGSYVRGSIGGAKSWRSSPPPPLQHGDGVQQASADVCIESHISSQRWYNVSHSALYQWPHCITNIIPSCQSPTIST